MIQLPDDEGDVHDQWYEDKVDLTFKTVADLHHLLTTTDLDLDLQLFRQSSKLHKELRKDLYSVSTKLSYSQDIPSTILNLSNDLSRSLQDYTNFLSPNSSKVSSQASSSDILDTTSQFSNFISSNKSSTDSEANVFSSIKPLLNKENSIICILLVLIFLVFIFLILIIFKCKTSCQKRIQGKELPLYSSYVRTSFSLEASICSTFPGTSKTCQETRRSSQPATVATGDLCSTLHNNFISKSPVYSPSFSFSTFHPPVQDRTSPEGSSYGDAEDNMEESHDGVCHGPNRPGFFQDKEGVGEEISHLTLNDERKESEESDDKGCDRKSEDTTDYHFRH